MTWFERLTGFAERDYASTQGALEVVDGKLRTRHSSNAFSVGRFELVSLGELRRRRASMQDPSGRLTVRNISGDARTIHQISAFRNAVIQVASQFNMLEMIHPRVTPEDGVSRYESDPTQGPACAIAAGAATIYRNYLVPIGGQVGQTADRQLDGLADVHAHLAAELGVQPGELWSMQNGYALCDPQGLRRIAKAIECRADLADEIRERLAIGLHWDVAVTDTPRSTPQQVTQVFCSALPVAYTSIHQPEWAPFAQIVLEAAYEATLCAAALNAVRGASNKVLLTRLGGGAFGNDPGWIDEAMARALNLSKGLDLEVYIVSFNAPPASMVRLAAEYAGS